MTREQAMREAQKRWGKRAAIQAGKTLTSQEARGAAHAEAQELRQRREALQREREERLKALDWLQQMNAEIKALLNREQEKRGYAHHYKFSVGAIDGVIGAFHIRGQGDMWEQAFKQAEGK